MNIAAILSHLFAAVANAVNACARTRAMLAAAIERFTAMVRA